MRSAAILTAGVFIVVAIIAPEAWAGTGGTSLPWETPLQTISNSITGPVAYAVSLIAIVVAGAMLVWGGEINEFARRVVMLVMVISLIVFASNILSTLFSVTGAVLP
jgi:type IV secretion system protein VirB2